MPESVAIVGAGLAGLACSVRLQERGFYPLLLEASDGVGGRVRTDKESGFLLDRGFQVLLTAYPETSRVLDYSALQLASFHAGALVRWKGRFVRVGDPTRHVSDLLPSAVAPIGSLADKVRILKLRERVCGPPLPDVLKHKETTTMERLHEFGFSERIIWQFFRPFLGGIFLETDLLTSSRKFEFVFRMFSKGTADLPKSGMGELPAQLAARLSPNQIRLNSRVVGIEQGRVHMQSSQTVPADHVVIATDGWSAARLLGQHEFPIEGATSICLYYAAAHTPVLGPWLVLNGDGFGPINNLCVPSQVQRSYAPEGKQLISVTVLSPRYQVLPDLESAVRAQLVEWYGSRVQSWEHLKSYQIPFAVPIQVPPALSPPECEVKLGDRLYSCGDYTGIASIEGAIRSGIRVAECISR